MNENMIINYFTRFPNTYIQCNIIKKFNVNLHFYGVYTLIDRNRTLENYSWFSIKEIFSLYQYSMRRNKPKVFYEIIDVLKYLVQKNMISVVEDLNSLTYSSILKIKINPLEFDCDSKWTFLEWVTFDKVMKSETKTSKKNLLLIYLFVKSNIGIRSKESSKKDEDYPKAFYKSISTTSKILNLSKNTVLNGLSDLVDLSLLKKGIVGNITSENGKIQKAPIPNVYVLNNDNWENELDLAYQKIKSYGKYKDFEFNTNETEDIIF